MASSFLENLKNSVETGEFNSDAAKKITTISEKSAEIEKNGLSDGTLLEKVDDRINKAGIKTVAEEEAALANSMYEEAMFKIREEEAAMKIIATLTDIEFAVVETISDMFGYIGAIEKSFKKENKVNNGLYNMIDSIKAKYIQFNQ